MLGLSGTVADQGWVGVPVPAGTVLGTVAPLYRKIETADRG